MQQARGALAVLVGVLTITGSLFGLVPKFATLDLDDVARVVYWASLTLVIGCIYFWLISKFMAWRWRRGTVVAANVLFWTSVAWLIMAGVGFVLFGPPLSDLGDWTPETTARATRWIAALSPPIFAAGGFVAYRMWMGHRKEREQQCDWCKEWVKLDARKCRYCGSVLEPEAHRRRPQAEPQPVPRDAPQRVKPKRRPKRQPAA